MLPKLTWQIVIILVSRLLSQLFENKKFRLTWEYQLNQKKDLRKIAAKSLLEEEPEKSIIIVE